MSNTTTTNSQNASDQQILSHFIHRKIRASGGPVSFDDIAYSVSNATTISGEQAQDLIDQGESSSIYTVSRGPSNEKQVTSVDRIGPEPDIVTSEFGGTTATSTNFATLDPVSDDIAETLDAAGYESFEELADADPETLANEINNGLDKQAEPSDFNTLSGLTESEITDIQSQGITTHRDLAQIDPQTVEDNATSTLREAKVVRAQRQIANKVTIYDESDTSTIISNARRQIPVGKELATKQLTRHRERKDAIGHAGPVITDTETQTNSVGEPLAEVRDNLNPDEPEAVYVSDIGYNEDDPTHTGLPVLEDVGYDKVPKLETDSDAGHSALPVDENGEVVPPTVPLERDLQLPIDELVAKKLARNVPVRIVGPRGSGKNYLMKYLCYKTNRGYRSLDVDKATMPQDLFGPITPNEDGKLEPKNAELKQGLINGDVIVINEFPVMQAGAAMSLHQLLNENKLVIKSHGQELEPHPQARIVITMNPPTREYRDSEPMNSATRGRFRSFWQGYPDNTSDEVDTLDQQVNTPNEVVPNETLKRIVEFAHRTRKDEFSNWPTLSTRNLTILCEHIADGASPKAATKNVLRMVAEPQQHPEDAFESLGEILK